MTVTYSLGTSTYTKQVTCAVVVDHDSGDAYVIRPDGQRDESLTARLDRLAGRQKEDPPTPEAWITLFGTNLSSISLAAPQTTDDIDSIFSGATQ